MRRGTRHGSGRRTVRAAAGALAVALLATLLGAAPASADPAKPIVSGWLPGWATAPAIANVEANPDVMGEASPFWYTAKASGGSVSLTATVDAATITAVLASLRARAIPVIPSVADGSSAKAMAKILKDPAARAKHVAELVALTTANGFDGIELDYEKFAFSDGKATWADTRPAWVSFIAELGNALHAAGRKLALAVPVMYDGNRSSSSGYWVYDYAGIAPYVDSLRIMTYDFSVSRPGPIAPLSFLRRTLDYAVTAFPASRIRMGIPAYGRLWTARRADGSKAITGTCPTTPAVPGTTSFTTATAVTYLTTMAGGPPVIAYDPASGEAYATFAKEYRGPGADGTEVACLVEHVAWWVDAQGVAARLALVAEYGLAGAAVWHLGGVDPASWQAIRAWAAGWTQPAPAPLVTPVVAPVAPSATSTTVTVKASTLTPKARGKVTVKVRVSPKKKGVLVRRQMLVGDTWKTIASKRTTKKGRVTFTIRWPKKPTSNTYRIITKATKKVPAGASEQFVITTR